MVCSIITALFQTDAESNIVGGHHSLVIAVTGEVYTCGNNDYRQLDWEGSDTRLGVDYSWAQPGMETLRLPNLVRNLGTVRSLIPYVLRMSQ